LDGEGARGDLVVVALPGVQRFITEARSTSDVSAASRIYSALARQVVDVLGTDGELVLPTRQDPPEAPASAADGRDAGRSQDARDGRDAEDGQPGLPNRIVALLPAGTGPAAARRASEAVHDAWRDWVRRIMPGDPQPQTPGFPRVQWVCIPEHADGYEAQWPQAQQLLAARRRVHDFPPVPEEDWRQRVLCSLASRWPAERTAPPHTPAYGHRVPLSAVGWVKRRWRHVQGTSGFPSAASGASAPYRRAVPLRSPTPQVSAAIRALDDARRAVEDVLGTPGRETPVPGREPLIPDGGPGA
jgi:hypothetical protein